MSDIDDEPKPIDLLVDDELIETSFNAEFEDVIRDVVEPNEKGFVPHVLLSAADDEPEPNGLLLDGERDEPVSLLPEDPNINGFAPFVPDTLAGILREAPFDGDDDGDDGVSGSNEKNFVPGVLLSDSDDEPKPIDLLVDDGLVEASFNDEFVEPNEKGLAP